MNSLLVRSCFLVGIVLAAPVLVLQAQGPPTMFPPVRGLHEMVGAANNFEVEAGYRILTQGGNAVDAGVASVLAASVTELNRFGIGGEMPVIIKMAGQPPVVISGVGVAPAKATVEFYARRSPEPWGRFGPYASGADARNLVGDHARSIRRPDSRPGQVRHQIFRRSCSARYRICRPGIPDAGGVRRHAAQLSANPGAVAGLDEVLLSAR